MRGSDRLRRPIVVAAIATLLTAFYVILRSTNGLEGSDIGLSRGDVEGDRPPLVGKFAPERAAEEAPTSIAPPAGLTDLAISTNKPSAVDPAPPSRRYFEIRVVDGQQVPVEGAMVYALNRGTGGLESTDEGAHTDANGICKVDMDQLARVGGDIILRAWKDGLGSRLVRVPIQSARADLQLEGNRKCDVSVKDDTGVFVSGATIQSIGEWGVNGCYYHASESITDVDGSCALEIGSGEGWSIAVTKPGLTHEIRAVPPSPGASCSLQVVLSRSPRLRIRALDEQDGCVGRVHFIVTDVRTGDTWQGATNDAGIMTLDSFTAAAREFRLLCSDDKYWAPPQNISPWEAARGDADVDVHVVPGATLTVDIRGGRAEEVPSDIRIERTDTVPMPRVVGRAHTTTRCAQAFHQLPLGVPLRIELIRYGAVEAVAENIVLSSGESTEIGLTAPKAVAVDIEVHAAPEDMTGSITMRPAEIDKAPGPGAPTKGEPTRAYSSEIIGSCRLEVVPGTYTVAFHSTSGLTAAESVTCKTDCQVVLAVGGVDLAAVIVDQHGAPRSGSAVIVMDGHVQHRVRLDSAGRMPCHVEGSELITIVGIEPGGALTTLAKALPLATIPPVIQWPCYSVAGEVRVVDGLSRLPPGRVRASRQGAQASGELLVSATTGASLEVTGDVSERGSFSIALSPGEWVVEAKCEPFHAIPTPISLRQGGEEQHAVLWVYEPCRLVWGGNIQEAGLIRVVTAEPSCSWSIERAIGPTSDGLLLSDDAPAGTLLYSFVPADLCAPGSIRALTNRDNVLPDK